MAKDNKKAEPIYLLGATLLFRNFSGKEGKYNPEGKRTFCVFLDPNKAADMKILGWNIKETKPTEDGDEIKFYIQVEAAFNNYPPTVYVVTENGRTQIKEEEINMLDWAEIVAADVKINPYSWDDNGNTRIKAYLGKLSVIIKEDPIERKYKSMVEERSAQDILSEETSLDLEALETVESEALGND